MAKAVKQRDDAKREAAEATRAADTAKQAKTDVEKAQAAAEKAQADAEALAKEAQAGYDEVAANVSEKQEEYRKAEAAVAARRGDLEVATKRGTFKLSDVVSKVIEVCADALEPVMPKAAQWLRDRADDLRERAIDAVAPETKQRRLADYDGPEDDGMQDDRELGG
jgi:DNA repair exonuclease SbcCD ATPase subunit